jgi:hypothetical protein
MYAVLRLTLSDNCFIFLKPKTRNASRNQVTYLKSARVFLFKRSGTALMNLSSRQRVQG